MKIAYVHPDAEGREQQVASKLYPRNQLWGADLLQSKGYEILGIRTSSQDWTNRFGKFLNKLTLNRMGDFQIEFQILRQTKDAEIIYAPSGHLFLIPILRRLGLLKAKIVTWFFRLPEPSSWWKFRAMRFSRYVLNGFDGILCLTRQTEEDFQARTNDLHVSHLAWFADPAIFSPAESPDPDEGYFLSVGKTRRDYATLLKACSMMDAPCRIIAPAKAAQGTQVPANVQFVETSRNPPDAAISYPELRNWYAGARAVLIPLTGDPGDTSGYTSLLEALIMGKPVLMTQSGCLDMDVESMGLGFNLPPGNPEAWAAKMRYLHENPEQAKKMGGQGLKLAREKYSMESFGNRLEQFLNNL